MKTQAAVAWQAGAPLTIEEVDLAGPRDGEVLVEVKATGICHTDYYTLSGADPEGLFPAILGHEGADYSFECIGNTQVMRQALECTHKGWGRSIIIGVAEAGAEISTRPFQLVTGRKWEGSAFGGARGRTDVPRIVDWYMDGKLNIDDLITHTLRLDQINEGFELMKRGESIRSVVMF